MPQEHELHRYHSPDKLKSLGENLYKQGKYEDALEVFSAAIAAAAETDLTLFDHLAATNEKLKRYKSALKDARQILKLDKTAATGYLRTGKILQIMEQPDLALMIYERGLQFVPASNAHFEVLRYRQKKLLRELVPPISIDPFTVLPIEIIGMIMAYLEFDQVCRCLRVSKGWQTVLTLGPSFWQTLDFGLARRTVRASTIYGYLAYAQFAVSCAILRKVDLQSTTLLRNLINKCTKLENLELQTGGFLGDPSCTAMVQCRHLKRICLSSSVTVQANNVLRIMKSCRSLVTAEFGDVRKMSGLCGKGAPFWDDVNLSNLREFAMTYEMRHHRHTTTLAMLCPRAAHLQSLDLKADIDVAKFERELLSLDEYSGKVNFDGLAERYPDLRRLKLDFVSHELNRNDRLRLPMFLQAVELHETDRAFFYIPPDWRYPLQPLQHLSEVIARDPDFNRHIIREFVQVLNAADSSNPTDTSIPSRLKKLDVEWGETTAEDLISLLAHPRLQDLTYLGLPEIMLEYGASLSMDDIARIVAPNFTKLQILDLSNNPGLTGVGVKAFVLSCPLLSTLRVANCDNIGSDAIEWTRARGIRISRGAVS